MAILVWRSSVGGPAQMHAPKALTLAVNAQLRPVDLIAAATEGMRAMNQQRPRARCRCESW
jgi:hypothetical protein